MKKGPATIMLQILTLIILTSSYGLANPFQPVADAQVPSGIEYQYSPPPIISPTALSGKRVAILASHGVEELEITAPYQYLVAQGAHVDIVVPSWTAEGIVASKFLKPTLFVRASTTFG